MSRKTERNKEIVRLHTDGGLTLQAIAHQFGITRERVRQIVRKAGVSAKTTRNLAHRRTYQTVRCAQCGGAFLTSRLRPQEHCSPYCRAEARAAARAKRAEAFDPLANMKLSRHDGHYWVSVPGERRRVRVERYLAERRAGRKLGPREWVVLRDGNPANLAPSNIAIMSPAEALEYRRRQREMGAAA